MKTVYITRRETFNAAHKLYREDWSEQKNWEVFGKCSNHNWHGHNFTIYVTVKGIPNPDTGFVINLKDLSEIVKQEVVEPLDHKNLTAGTFKHYMYLSHVDVSKPTVFITEGYNAIPRTYELSKIFKGNQVQVEYRFYGKSRPDIIPWQYLKNDLAIEDYHKIITKLNVK